MSQTYNQFIQTLGDISSGFGSATGAYTGNELFIKPAVEKQKLIQQRDRAIFNGDFGTAALLTQKLGQADETWDQETAERDIPRMTPMPMTPVSVESLSTDPSRPGIFQGAKPLPLTQNPLLAQLSGQNLATNPLGLRETTASLPSLLSGVEFKTTLRPETDAEMAASALALKPQSPLGPTGKPLMGATETYSDIQAATPARGNRVVESVDYGGQTFEQARAAAQAPKAAPMSYQSLGTSSLGTSPEVDLYDFTPAKEIYQTGRLADTAANRQRLMSLYGGKAPEPEFKTDYNDAIIQVTPGYGLLAPKTTVVAKGGIGDKYLAGLESKEAIAALSQENQNLRAQLRNDASIYGTDKRYAASIYGADRRFNAAVMRLNASLNGDQLSGLSKDESKAMMQLFTSVQSARNKYEENQINATSKVKLFGASGQAVRDQISAQADELAASELRNRVRALRNPRMIQAAEEYLTGESNAGAFGAGAGTMPGAPAPVSVATPAPPAPVTPPRPIATPAVPPGAPPVPAASPRPSVAPPNIPPTPRPPAATAQPQRPKPQAKPQAKPSAATQRRLSSKEVQKRGDLYD